MSSGITRNLPDGRSALYTWFGAMHTRIDLLLVVERDRCGVMADVAERVRSLVTAIEVEGNCFNPDSLLSRFNRLPPGVMMREGLYLYEMLSLCRHYHVLTQGIFDVTVGSERHTADLMQAIVLSDDGSMGRLDDRTSVNLSGFIKGYALDRVHILLQEAGVADAVVNMGNSSVMAVGDVPVRMPRRCLTTSGNTEGLPCQIVDPRNHHAITRSGVVQVATDSGAEGEVLATAFFVAEPESADEARLLSLFPDAILTRKS